MNNWATLAANTQLPPSPEMKPVADNQQYTTAAAPSRLRSIAKYAGSFQPQALACSPPVASSYADVEQASSQYTSKKHGSETAPPSPSTAVSLGAIAGLSGVALFRVTRPESPLLVFNLGSAGSHAHEADTISSLAFQESIAGSSNSFYLAAAKGSSALVWDASGHSPSPLRCRLRVDNGSALSADAHIKSLIWKPNTEWLAAATAATACLWDLREPNSSAMFKPSLRFGVTRRTGMTAPNVQVACSDNHECAVIDAAGRLRVFDMRKPERGRGNAGGGGGGGGALYSVSAFQHAGIGVSWFPTDSKSTPAWLSWGVDFASQDAAVRVWTSTDASSEPVRDSEDVWYMDGAAADPNRSTDGVSVGTRHLGCQLIGQCSVGKLACARVCLSSMKDSFVTIGFDDVEEQQGWRANVWKLRKPREGTKQILQSISSFIGGNEAKALGLTDTSLGTLCGAELAMMTKAEASTSSENAESDLLLCCLTDKGFVTTHVVPGAVNESVVNRDAPRIAKLDNLAAIRIFPPPKEAPLADVARIWGEKRKLNDDRLNAVARLASDESGTSTDLISSPMPFDMDTPGAYSLMGVSATVPESSKDAVPVNIVTESEKERSEEAARDAAVLMSRIEKDRIPCPRLCGASFSPGIGGLALFSNGEVKKMWRWWDKDAHTRVPRVSAFAGETESHASRVAGDHAPPPILVGRVTRECPRTLQDLHDMVAAAKEAQWGDQDDSDMSSTNEFRLLTAKFFDDDASDNSSASLEDDSTTISGSQRDMYESYFSEATRPLTTSSSGPFEKSSDDSLGPSSDILSSHVSVSHAYDGLVCNSQSQVLAIGWKLGTGFFGAAQALEGDMVAPAKQEATGSSLPTEKSAASLPRYRFLVPPIGGPNTQNKSESFAPIKLPERNLMKTKIPYEDDLERGVHGGEYSVRPNMQESMVFLKKLFTQQQKEKGTAISHSAMFSPPDSPMLPNSLSKGIIGQKKAKRVVSLPDVRSPPRRVPVGGVSVLRAINPDPDSRLSHILLEISDTCLYNSFVSEALGEISKRDTWKLLAKAVESRVRCHSTFSGDWGRSAGDALGINLVRNILNYYEKLRDIQMLASIVCVLRNPILESRPGFKLLPAGADEQKYDGFIEKYANMLYSWGLLTLRAELNKHLSRVPECVSGGDTNNENQSPGISLAIQCPRCAKQVGSGSGNFCDSCKDFAFRCSICDTAVRGLFSLCDACGHGGHVRHLTAWFAEHEECPTGCGCRCIGVRAAAAPSPLPRPGGGEHRG